MQNRQGREIQKLCARVKGAAHRMKRRLPHHVDVDDLVAAGYLGLARALANWREGSDDAFEAYALRCATGAMLDELRAGDQLTRRQRDVAAVLRETEARLVRELGRPPEQTEIAARLGTSAEDLSSLRARTERSIRVSLGTDSILPVASPVPHPEAALEETQRARRLSSALDGLPERLQTILALCCSEDLTLKEIGERLGVTEARVCQLRKQAVARLRESCRETLMPPAPAHAA